MAKTKRVSFAQQLDGPQQTGNLGKTIAKMVTPQPEPKPKATRKHHSNKPETEKRNRHISVVVTENQYKAIMAAAKRGKYWSLNNYIVSVLENTLEGEGK